MATSDDLRQIFAAGRPLIEEWLDVGEQIAALRDVAASKGLDWSQLKALMKAQIQDERDETGNGKRVSRIVEKAEFASAYADMLGLANMNENNFSAGDYATATGREITEHEQPEIPANEIHERPSTNDKAYLEAVPQDEASLAGTGSRMLADREGRSEGEAASADLPTNSHPQPTSSPEADKTGEVATPLPASPVAISDADVPAFLRKDAGPVDVTSPEFIKRLRPFCQHLDNCTGYGRECPKCKAARAA